MTPRWVIRLLGTFEIEHDGQPLPDSVWHTQQAKQVLKILILAHGRPVPAERLMEWLWPGTKPSATAVTLRSTVHALRRVLEPDRAPRQPARYIVTRPPGYAFEPDETFWIDVYAFEDLLDQAARTRHPGHKRHVLAQALNLYRGDLLEEDPYAEWALLERERLRERYLDALLDLAELHAQAGDLDRAIAACRRALARDEYREAAYRALMRYQVLAGDVAAALNTYERCRTMLREEFGAEPAPQTQALYQAILRGEIPGGPSPVSGSVSQAAAAAVEGRTVTLLPHYDLPFGTVFVGRRREHAWLIDQVDRATKGQGGLVVVTGDMGMGKTHLVLHALHRRAERVDLVGTRCLALEQDLPFAPLIQVMRRLADHLPAARWREVPPFALAQVALFVPTLHYQVPDLPAVPDTTPEENRTRLIDGFASVLVALSDQTPLVLFFDDIHWADAETLAVLGRLAYRARRHPLLVVVTYPPDALAENEALRTLVVQWRHDGVAETLSLTPLDERDVAHFLAHVWDRPVDAVADLAAHVYTHTEGIPLYVVEVVREAVSRGRALPRPEDLPPVQNLEHVRTLILNRVARLPRVAQDTLQLAAVLGRTFALDVLETAAPFDPLPGLEALLKARFLQEEESGRLSFVHEVVRQVVYASLPTLARRRWHRRVAEALVALHGDQGAHTVQVAYHYRQAGSRYVRDALRFTVLAAEHLRRTYGFRQACDHYRRALRLAEQALLDEEVYAWMRRAYIGLGLAYEALGDWEGIVTTYTAMRRWAETRGDGDLALLAARRLVGALTVVGRLDDAATTAGEVIAAMHHEASPVADVFQRLHLVFAAIQPEPAEDAAADWPAFTPAAAVQGKPWEEVVDVIGPEMAPLPLALYGWSLGLQGYLDEAEASLRHAAGLAIKNAQVPYAVLAHHFWAHVAFMREDFAALQAHLDEGFRLARQAPDAEWSTWWARVFEGYVHLHIGEVAAARQRFAALDHALADRRAFRSHHRSAWVGLALVAVREHNVEEALARLDHVLAEWEMLDVVTAFWAYVAAAAVARHRGQWEEAHAYARKALAFAGRRGLLFEYASAVEEVVRLAQAQGDIAAALPLVRQVEAFHRQRPVPVVRRVLTRLQARLGRALAPS